MGDSIYEKMGKVSANQIAESLEGHLRLTPEQLKAADVNGDGQIDEQDIELLAAAELKLANKISGAIVGMEALSEEEKRAADQNHDGHINLTDSYRLADDARAAKHTAAKIHREKQTGH